MTQGNNNQL